MRKRTVSLVGSNTILGNSLIKLRSDFLTIEHPTESLVWKKPLQVERILTKGNPDVYVLCYSVLDGAESQLLSYLRSVVKIAKVSKAKIIGFVDFRIFDGNSFQESFDEGIQPYPESQEGKMQLTFEERLLRYPNSLVFRLGRFWSEDRGAIHSFLKSFLYGERVRLSNECFSLTSEETLLRGVSVGINDDMVLTQNLVDRGVVTESSLLACFPEIDIDSSFFEEVGSGIVLDGKKWETLSMTEGEEWSSYVRQKVSNILKSLYGT